MKNSFITFFIVGWFFVQVAVLPLIHNHSHHNSRHHCEHCDSNIKLSHHQNHYSETHKNSIYSFLRQTGNCQCSNDFNKLKFNAVKCGANHFCIGCFAIKQLLLLLKFILLIIIIILLHYNFEFQKYNYYFLYYFLKFFLIFLRAPPRYSLI